MKFKVLIVFSLIISFVLMGCNSTDSEKYETKTYFNVTTPNGASFEVTDVSTQDSYLNIFKNKQKIEGKPGYLSTNNKYTVDYEKDGKQGTFEFFIEPSFVEMAIELNQNITSDDIVYIVDSVISSTELELSDLVFKDSFGLLLDARIYGSGSNKTISFNYSKNSPFKVSTTSKPTLSSIAFTTTLAKQVSCRNTVKELEIICKGIERTNYNTHNYPKTPEAIIPHLYRSFIFDDSGNWFRISNSDVVFLIKQNDIYNSLKNNI